MRERPAELFGSATALVAEGTDEEEAAVALAEEAGWSPSALLGAYGVAESLARDQPLDTGVHRAAALLRLAMRRAMRPPTRQPVEAAVPPAPEPVGETVDLTADQPPVTRRAKAMTLDWINSAS
jgi:hypothetical protein